ADPGVKVMDPAPKLCSSNDWCRVELDGQSLYTDDNHLSAVGSRYVEAFLEPLFKALRDETQASAL
ncbi:SGNH hydrolase domain-containing protein, partial [Salmonella enterica]|uniref:SGNH hydrolase domain-containing protein n=1 Tax=Salmonella enterica TaxID=28901 RepID=UPI0022B6B64B